MAHPGHSTEDKNLLTSWKEIATYLGRDVRTCLRWERKFGLPIHRLDPKSDKSRVFAYKEELDRWLRQAKTGRSRVRGSHSQIPFMAGLFLVIGAVAAALLWFFKDRFSPGEPADFAIKGSELAVLDDGGHVLWRYDTGLENLCAEETYRAHFQFRRSENTAKLPFLLMKDLNRDGRREVLFSLQTQDETREGEVFCFDRKGRPLWHFRAGRQMKCGDKTYSGDFRIHGLLAEDCDGNGQLEVIVVSVHRPSWPCQLALLDAQGSLKGEFWNAGYFNDLGFADLDGDGIKEIIAGGNHNESGRGCLAVFNSKSISGGSPQAAFAYRCPGLGPGSELFYVLLPRTDVDQTDCYPVDAVVTVDILDNRRIQAKTSLTDLFYQFTFDFRERDVIFIQAHEKARLAGIIQSHLDSEYEHRLLEEIRYWDGGRWTPEPAGNQIQNRN